MFCATASVERAEKPRLFEALFYFKHIPKYEVNALSLQFENFLSFADNAFAGFLANLNWILVRVEIFIEDIILGDGNHILNEDGFLATENTAKIYGVAFAISSEFVGVNALKLFNFRGYGDEPEDVAIFCKGEETWAFMLLFIAFFAVIHKL